MTTPIVRVREAVEEDFDAVRTLYTDMLVEYEQTFPERYKDGSESYALEKESFLEALAVEGWSFIVVEDDGEIVGAAEVYLEEDEENEVRKGYVYSSMDNIAIKPGSRDGDTAKALIDGAVHWAMEQGAPEMDVIVTEPFEGFLLPCFYEAGFSLMSSRLRRQIGG